MRISRRNRKFGRAKNLRSRYKNYLDVFDEHAVTFKVIAFLDNFVAVESVCLKRLNRFRIRGASGRRHE